MTDKDAQFMKRAIELARAGMDNNDGGPFGCVVVKDGKVVGEGNNRVTSTNDPTAHAEVVAIREACRTLNTFQLDGCSIYTSCEPCPMCLGAIYWARPSQVFYACTREDAAAVGFDDDFIYDEVSLPNQDRERVMINLLRDEGVALFQAWDAKADKIEY
ncbi:MAG: nucleoside deaminase [Pyrinomonadaceae bacterium]|nr:nucleoside deaminase [Acidobacteriota bacterium]MBK7933725.1 nucleoside deaminase [Acidobacteriota bacterium]MBP7377210.1 nucleoside deaminase [Pyrinomonadaceae bacterium]